jgi:hypothetical protein
VLGLPIRKVVIPVAAGRNIAVLLEAAVRNTILQLRGIDTLAGIHGAATSSNEWRLKMQQRPNVARELRHAWRNRYAGAEQCSANSLLHQRPAMRRLSMRIVLITGISGSGKSVALNVLEDTGHYCVDNLPPALLSHLVATLAEEGLQALAVAVDARSAESLVDAAGRRQPLREKATTSRSCS